MVRDKPIGTSLRFLAVNLERQHLPGSFAHAVHHLLEHDLDLSGFDERYCNDIVEAAAYPPRMLLRVILCAYAEGVGSRRGIERLCCEHVTFIALSGDTRPHFTPLAAFVSRLGREAPKHAPKALLRPTQNLRVTRPYPMRILVGASKRLRILRTGIVR
ncbi:MAG TPA: transposase [Rhodocyclaceae bacterium]|nr:transposase [Rhodocyclaceae bacterium]